MFSHLRAFLFKSESLFTRIRQRKGMGSAGKLTYVRLDTLAKNQAYDNVKWGGQAKEMGKNLFSLNVFYAYFDHLNNKPFLSNTLLEKNKPAYRLGTSF